MSTSGAALVHRDFRRYLVVRLCLNLALQMATVAIGWQVYDLTRDPLNLGFVGLAQFLPSVGLVLFAGSAADRFDRRRVIALGALGELACTLILAANAFGHTRLWLVYSAAVLLGVCRTFLGPALQALLPRLVPMEHFSNAVSWNLIFFQIGMTLGPALGGLIYGAFNGPTAVFVTAGSLASIGILAVLDIRTSGRTESVPQGSRWQVLLAGIRYVWEQKLIFGAISLDLFAVLLGGAVALLPIFARDILETGPWGLGLLRAAPAAGAATMALYLTRHPFERHLGRKMFAGVLLFGFATILFGLSRHFALSLVALVGVGAADMAALQVRQMLVQLSTPDAMRGRVSAVAGVFVGASNELGEFESGVTAAWWGAPRAVIYGGIGTCLVVASWARLFPQLRQVDRLLPRHADTP